MTPSGRLFDRSSSIVTIFFCSVFLPFPTTYRLYHRVSLPIQTDQSGSWFPHIYPTQCSLHYLKSSFNGVVVEAAASTPSENPSSPSKLHHTSQSDSLSTGTTTASSRTCERSLTSERTPNSCFDLLFVSLPFSPVQTAATLAATLQQRGHSVHFLSFDTVRSKVEKLGVKMTSVGLGVSEDEMDKMFQEFNHVPFWKIFKKAFGFMNNLMNGLDRGIQQYVQSVDTPPDLVVVTCVTNSTLLSDLSLPYVTIFPTVAVAPLLVGIPYASVFPGPPHGQSLILRLSTIIMDVLFYFIFPVLHFFPSNLLHLMHSRKGLTLISSLPGFDYPYHTPPLTQFVGPIVTHLRTDSSTIETDVLNWMERATDTRPIIYFSMGTVVHLTAQMQQRFFDALRPSPPNSNSRWRVLWSLPKNQWAELPSALNPSSPHSNEEEEEVLRDMFKVVAWTSSPAVLEHPRVKAFLSHCGGNGVHESLLAGTPIVGVPFFGDQPLVCQRVGYARVGVALPRGTIEHTEETNRPPGTDKPAGTDDEGFVNRIGVQFSRWLLTKLKGGEVIQPEAIRKALEEVIFVRPKMYQDRLKELRSLIKLYGGAEKAADWVETAAYMKGALNEWLETAVDKDGIVKAFSLDIALVVVLVSVVCVVVWLYISIKVVKCMYRRCFGYKQKRAVLRAPKSPARSSSARTETDRQEEEVGRVRRRRVGVKT
eukprot:GHVS01084385.1.p1 GENE.GHVS01084385.1~~GHVS01084385.1.p1  ORF type:complete len:706 (+),score=104.80 GHVS01084385.1:99-2216(+)